MMVHNKFWTSSDDLSSRAPASGHDGRYLAYASDDALIDVADVRTGETVKQLACKGSVPEKLAWNPKHLAFAFAGGGGDFPVSVVTPN